MYFVIELQCKIKYNICDLNIIFFLYFDEYYKAIIQSIIMISNLNFIIAVVFKYLDKSVLVMIVNIYIITHRNIHKYD